MTDALQHVGPIYAITDYDRLNHQQIMQRTQRLFEAGINILQYRNKLAPADQSYHYARALQQLCCDYGALFIINDDLELARQLDADGLHIGKQDVELADARQSLSDKLIGVSCYNQLHAAINAAGSGADYIAFGSFFPSSSKPQAVRADLDLIKQTKSMISVPIVAIGGITLDNAGQLVTAGADYLALISGLYEYSDPYSQAVNFLKLYQSH